MQFGHFFAEVPQGRECMRHLLDLIKKQQGPPGLNWLIAQEPKVTNDPLGIEITIEYRTIFRILFEVDLNRLAKDSANCLVVKVLPTCLAPRIRSDFRLGSDFHSFK